MANKPAQTVVSDKLWEHYKTKKKKLKILQAFCALRPNFSIPVRRDRFASSVSEISLLTLSNRPGPLHSVAFLSGFGSGRFLRHFHQPAHSRFGFENNLVQFSTRDEKSVYSLVAVKTRPVSPSRPVVVRVHVLLLSITIGDQRRRHRQPVTAVNRRNACIIRVCIIRRPSRDAFVPRCRLIYSNITEIRAVVFKKK